MSATYYDPDRAPNPSGWLALGENERIRLAQNYHVSIRVKVRNLKTHAVLHAVVENQIATGHGPSCRAVERLQREGLSRHEAIHAIGAVVAEIVHESLNGVNAEAATTVQSRMNSAIQALSANSWRDSTNGGRSDG